jgi:hypothetical protein
MNGFALEGGEDFEEKLTHTFGEAPFLIMSPVSPRSRLLSFAGLSTPLRATLFADRSALNDIFLCGAGRWVAEGNEGVFILRDTVTCP